LDSTGFAADVPPFGQTGRVTRTRSVFRCDKCGAQSHKWSGQCPTCEAWNCLVESVESSKPALSTERQAQPITSVESRPNDVTPTGVDQLDTVLSGGLVTGSVTLLGGEPGIGKSTLLLQVAGAVAKAGRTVLYVAAEESVEQVRERAHRLEAGSDRLLITDAIEVSSVAAEMLRLGPDLVVVDSIQTIHDSSAPGAPGSVSQVRDCAQQLVREARRTGAAVVLVGHVTKDGGIAGPRVLEHVVDTVLTFEGDRHHGLRFLRAVKHRFGSTRTLGVFEMAGSGLQEVADPSRLFLADRSPGIAGSVVVPIVDGARPLLVEVQALVVGSELQNPRRVSQGLDGRRLSLLLAVLDRHAGLCFNAHDVYVSAVGGVRITEPGADLAVALAVVSSLTNVAMAANIAVCGEIGLGGEIRQVGDIDRRFAEAGRMGFTSVVAPARSPQPTEDVNILRASTLSEILNRTGLIKR